MDRNALHCPEWCDLNDHIIEMLDETVAAEHRAVIGTVTLSLREIVEPQGWTYADEGRATISVPGLDAAVDLGTVSHDLYRVALLLDGEPARLGV